MRPKRYPYSKRTTLPSIGRVKRVIRNLALLHRQFDNEKLSEYSKEMLKGIVKSELESLTSYDLEIAPTWLVVELRVLQEFH